MGLSWGSLRLRENGFNRERSEREGIYLSRSTLHQRLGDPEQELRVEQLKVPAAQRLAFQSHDMEVPGLLD